MIPTLAIAAALALAPSAEAGFKGRFAKRFGFPSRQNRPRNTGGFRSHRTVQVSSSKCHAVANSKSFVAYRDAHVHAVKSAWLHACSTEVNEYYWADIYKHIEKSDGAYAFAKAMTEVHGSCRTRGNAYGCAAAYSYATAWADAVATVHAAAWSEAIAECKCNPDLVSTIVATESDSYASEAAYLAADVQSLSRGHTCAKGYQRKSFYQAQTCLQNVYATILAKAVAKAAIDGECVHRHNWQDTQNYQEYTAEAYTEATAKITLEHVYGCVPYVDGYNPYH